MTGHEDAFKQPFTLEQLRARARRGALICRVIAFALLVGALFAIDHVSPLFRDGVASLGWTRTEGQILQAGRGWKRVILDDGEGHEAWLRLWYAYEVPTAAGGTRYLTGGSYDVSTERAGSKHEHSMTTIGMARTCLADAPRIPVYYDPDDPERAVVRPGIPYSTGGWTILVTSLFVVALWLLRAAKHKGKYDPRSFPEQQADEEPEPPPEEEPGAHYVKDEYGEYWTDDAPDETEPQSEESGEFAEDELAPGASKPSAVATSQREVRVLGAVLVGIFVPLGGFILMGGGAFLWEKWIGGVPPSELVLLYCAFALLMAVAPRLAATKVGGSCIAACTLGLPLLGAIALGYVMYEDFSDTDVRWISYEPQEAWLIEQMRSEHPTVREVAVRAAGYNREFEAARPLILELCNDPNPDVADSARHAAHRHRLRWR